MGLVVAFATKNSLSHLSLLVNVKNVETLNALNWILVVWISYDNWFFYLH